MFNTRKKQREITVREKNAIIIEYLSTQVELFGNHPDTIQVAQVCDELLHFERIKRRYLT